MRDLLRMSAYFLLGVWTSSGGKTFPFKAPTFRMMAQDFPEQSKPLETQQNQGSSAAAVPAIPSYSNSPDGLETLMKDMITLEKQGHTVALAPYFQSLVLPNPEEWFKSKFGDEHCGDEHQGANDCLGTRLALRYASTARNLPAAAALTLSDLVDEQLTNFEAVNHSELCASPRRILPAYKLVANLSVTPILSSVLSRLVQRQEPVYVVWSYSETEETTVGFFVYSDGAFRFIGMPHPVSLEELARKHEPAQQAMGPIEAPNSPPLTDDLTNEVVALQPVLADQALIQRTVVLHVIINENGKAVEVSYVRGPETFKAAAMETVKQRQFERQSIAGRSVRLSTCIDVVSPQ